MDGPVAGPEDLALDEPLAGALERGVGRGRAGVEQRAHRLRGVERGRHARLVEQLIAALRQQIVQPLHAADDGGMVGREADGMQGEDRLHHRRLDARPLSGGVLVPQHPFDGARHRTASQRLPAHAAEQRDRAVERQEDVAPRQHRRRARERQVARRRLAQPELPHVGLRRHPHLGAMHHQQRERHERGARPAGEAIDVERRPRRQQDHLDRHARDARPRELPEAREPEAGEHSRAREAAAGEHHLARPRERRLGRPESGQPEGEVGLDGRREMGGQTRLERPAAVGLLGRQQALRHAAVLFRTLPSEQAVDEDVLGLEVRRALDASLPVAAGTLLREQRA